MIKLRSIASKMIIPMVLLVVVVGGISVLTIQHMLSQSLTVALKQKGIASCRSLAAACIEPLLLDETAEIEEILTKEKRAVSGLKYAFIVDAAGHVVAHTFEKGFPLHLLWENMVASDQTQQVVETRARNTTVFDFAVPMTIDDRIVGVSRMGFTDTEIRRAVRRLAMVSTLTLVLLLAAGAFGAVAWTRAIVRPIGVLRHATQNMMSGDLNPRVEIQTGDEIELLAKSFNRMAQTVLERTGELSRANINLEKAQRIAHMGNWEWDLVNDKFSGSDECYLIFGKEPGSLIPDLKTYLEYIHHDDVKLLQSAFDKAIKGIAPFNLEHRIMHTDGSQRFVHGRGEVVHDESGRPVRMIGTLQDITEARQAQEALRRAHDELEIRVKERTAELAIAKDRAEESDRLKSAFLATMSHELRTPLNSIIGFTGIILQGMVGTINDEQRKQLTMVSDSAHHLLALINDVLDISKIEAGQLEIHSEKFAVREAVDKALRVIHPLADRKKLNVTANIAADVGEIYSDQRRFEQILINVLNNAVKFTESGNISLAARLRKSEAESHTRNGRMLEVSIADTGIGIKPDDVGKLFKPFQQIDTGTSRKYEGTGLGLSICRKLAQLLGGSIDASSDGEGKGSTFTLTIPCEKELS